MQYDLPKLEFKDGQVTTEYPGRGYVPNDHTTQTVKQGWYDPYPEYSHQCRSDQEQTVELEISAKKIIIKGKNIRIKVEEME